MFEIPGRGFLWNPPLKTIHTKAFQGSCSALSLILILPFHPLSLELIESLNLADGDRLACLMGVAEHMSYRKVDLSEKPRPGIPKKKGYALAVRRDLAHKACHAVATTSGLKAAALEKLNVGGITKAPAPKAGLNAAILCAGWGLYRTFLAYKLERRNRLLVEVPAS